MKIKLKNKNNQSEVKVKISSLEKLDEEELDFVCRVFIRGFFKPSIYKNKTIIYRGIGGISLKNFLKGSVSKYDFFFIMHQIVSAAYRIQKSSLHLNRLWLNIDAVFIHKMTKELQFIYLPVNILHDNSDIMSFMQSVAYMVKPKDDNGDTDFVSRFMYFLSSMSTFDGAKIEKYIEQEDSRITRVAKQGEFCQEHVSSDKDRLNNDQVNLAAENGKTDMLNFCFENSLGSKDFADVQKDDSTLLLSGEATALPDEDESTELLGGNEETELIRRPTLKRLSTGEIISVDKVVFRLGKDKSCVDYVVTNNNTVSKSHADIVSRKDRYYVIDLNSKNKTYINNRVLPAQYEVEIFDKDILRLSNEEFIFGV